VNTELYNRTRESTSIASRLVREGRFYLLPLYYVLRLSDLAREGVENSGSFRFADHIYRYEASGRFGIGTLLDWVILRLPSSRSFRSRYLCARSEILKHARLIGAAAGKSEVHVLSVPCGLPRELRDSAVELRRNSPDVFARMRYHCMDLDPEPLALARQFVAEERLETSFSFHHGNALDARDLPQGMDIVTSTGLAEFLTEEQLATLYRNVHGALTGGGVFITSGMKRHAVSDWLMRTLAELHTQYRDMDDLERVATRAGFDRLRLYSDDVGIQTILVARKG
jgi:hypothetical protein